MDFYSSSSSTISAQEEPHVLAVDDNLIDRKLVEKLLKKSSCKGSIYFYLFIFSLVNV